MRAEKEEAEAHMKKRYYKFKHFKYINGIRGSISLFLMVLMTPFLSIAMMLVETGRFNSAVSVMDEAMGVSATSTLADYDDYLHDRWGLLGMSQDGDIPKNYRTYLDENIGVMGNSLNLQTVKAEGMYPLADLKILEKQILEFQKLNAPTKLAQNFLNITDLVKVFESLGPVEMIASLLGKAADGAAATSTLIDSASDLKSDAAKLEKAKTPYQEKYDAFVQAVDDLKAALKEERPDEEEDKKAAEDYDANIADLQKKATDAQKAYSECVSEVKDTMSDFKSKMGKCGESLNSINHVKTGLVTEATNYAVKQQEKDKEVKKTQDAIDAMKKEGKDEEDSEYAALLEKQKQSNDELAEMKTEQSIVNATMKGLNATSDSWTKSTKGYSDEKLGKVIEGFENIRTKTDAFDVSAVTAETDSIDDATYHNMTIDGYVKADEIDDYLAEQNDELEKANLKAFAKGLKSFFDALIKMTIFYNPDYAAYVDTNYYEETFGGLPGGNAADGGIRDVINSFSATMDSYNTFTTTLNLAKKFKALYDTLKNVVKTINAIIQFVIDIGINLARLITEYDHMYCSTYMAFNLPCRTDSSFKCMTGYSLSLPEWKDKNEWGLNTLNAVVQTLQNAQKGTGPDKTFSGAELEYILYGSNSEVANQVYTFFALYLIRFLLDVGTVSTDVGVQALAGASTLGYPFVLGAILLLEPFAETVLLANGAKIKFIGETVYLTPEGFPKLIGQILTFVHPTEAEQKDMETGFIECFGAGDEGYQETYAAKKAEAESKSQEEKKETEEKKKEGIAAEFDSKWNNYQDGFLKFDYREYCFFVLLLTVKREQQIARLANLIQMETLSHYSKQGAPYVFDLRKSYTFLHAEADVKVNQMLPALIDSKKFQIKREQYRGY